MGKATITTSLGDGEYDIVLDEGERLQPMTVWCADLTEDLSGEVGTSEIAGDTFKGVNIQPGYAAEGSPSPSIYDALRDGGLYIVPQSGGSQHSSGVYWNYAMLPGWQKWMPNYRYGKIGSVDSANDTCNLVLFPCYSEAEPDGIALDVNQVLSLKDVAIEYMNCNAAAFSEGDIVIVKFTDNDWTKPKVIGFKEEPQVCFKYVIATIGSYCSVWDIVGAKVADDIPTNDNPEVMATFPTLSADISDWVAGREERTFDTLFSLESIDADMIKTEVIESGPGWYTSTTTGASSTAFGENTYELVHSWTAVDDMTGETSHTLNRTITEDEDSATGFILTALNGSEDELSFKVTKDLLSSELSLYTATPYLGYVQLPWGYENPGVVREGNLKSSSFDYDETESLTPSTAYFSVSSQLRVADYECSGGESNDYTCTPIGENPSALIELKIKNASHYSEEYKAVIQLFVYKDESDAYHGYGQADSGLADYTVAPSELSENGDLSSALQSLAVTADSYVISADYY